MKVGLSFSGCVRDIVAGRVSIGDVLVVMANTDFDPTIDEQWQEIWHGYRDYEWRDHQHLGELHFREIARNLWQTGRIHQWRRFTNERPRVAHMARYPWMDVIIPPEDLHDRPAVRQAWGHYQIVAGLCRE